MKLKTVIKRHPRLSNAVEFDVMKDNFSIESGSVVKATLTEAFEEAKRRVVAIFPQITMEELGELQLPDGN
jgi:hypothetical protein